MDSVSGSSQANPSGASTGQPSAGMMTDPVDPMEPTVAPPAAEPSEPPVFAVGDHARHTQLGVDRPVFGVRRSPEGEFLLFSAEGQWQPAAGFELLPPQE
jgi:hypothetical protein